jgi:coproporphyrinogen III oxidase-like Fe-S oxidoreductase
VLRQMRWKHPNAYLDNIRSGRRFRKKPGRLASLPFEFMMNALRLADGFPPALFEARTAQPLSNILPKIKAAEAEGLLEVGPERIAPTLKGRRFLNVLLERFL